MKVELSYNIYRPEDYALGIIQVVHGMSEYGQRYEKFAQYMCKKGFVVITYDHRGHGPTCAKEDLGFFDSEDGWLRLIEDAHFITDVVKREYPPNVPFILLGHSMGSLVARSYLKRFDYELDGLILSGPPTYQIAARGGVMLAKHYCKKEGEKARNPLLEKLSTGNFGKKFENKVSKNEWISKSTKNVENYDNDPLCGFPFTNKGYEDLFRLMIDMNSIKGWQCTNPKLPIFFVSGEYDPVTGGNKGLLNSINRLKRAGYSNISQFVYPEMRHEILNEDNQEEVFKDIFEWVSKNCLRKNG
ncbi:MAG: alpha/beta fold hydrolase [Anaerorhabdus sp.]|uniref:alpha/beta fold hydrolase n=1 Tax=Anaerorhabdus sp. TaxID=1872524 RepID=UPI002FCBFA0A